MNNPQCDVLVGEPGNAEVDTEAPDLGTEELLEVLWPGLGMAEDKYETDTPVCAECGAMVHTRAGCRIALRKGEFSTVEFASGNIRCALLLPTTGPDEAQPTNIHTAGLVPCYTEKEREK